ncbi:hypothetical protein GCM10017607_01230 [Microbacterium thalassium]|nr:hypothetical protein GCM10017607_01230 [Microbacterium thalassium]
MITIMTARATPRLIAETMMKLSQSSHTVSPPEVGAADAERGTPSLMETPERMQMHSRSHGRI